MQEVRVQINAVRPEQCIMCKQGYEAVRGLPMMWHPEGYVQVQHESKRMLLHVYLVQHVLNKTIPSRHVVHHKNGVRADNRLANLEIAARSLNSQAKAKRKGCSSDFLGVCKKGTSWCARMRVNYQHRHIGCFTTQAEAAKAYDRAVLAVHGPDARLNGLLSEDEVQHVLEYPDKFVPTQAQSNKKGQHSKAFLQAALADPERVLGPMPCLPDGTPYIQLSGARAAGRVVKVDAQGWQKAAMYKWYVIKCGSKEYAEGRVLQQDGCWVSMKMHRYLMNCTLHDNRIIDHIDGDSFNNQLANLRDTTASSNARNKASRPGSSSPYRGVFWESRRQRWCSKLSIQGKAKFLGYFEDQEAAHQAYQQAAQALEEQEPGVASSSVQLS